MADLPLNPDWCVSTPTGGTCTYADLGTFPANGMLVTLGTAGYGPGPQLGLGPGRSTTLGGRPAHVTTTEDTGSTCPGVGATHSVDYAVADSRTQGHLYLDFCYSGPDAAGLRTQVAAVARSLRIRPAPGSPSLTS